MADVIKIPFAGKVEEAIKFAETEAKKFGYEFHGDIVKGHFSVKGVVGTYEVTDAVIVITVTKKPFFLPVALIASELKKVFK